MRNSKLDSLQVLRGFAAVGVVAHHSFRAITINRPASIDLPAGVIQPDITLVSLGSAGVDMFFILSGFLMFYISEPYFMRTKSIGHFISQRLIRIWPLYAIITAVACIDPMREAVATGSLPFDLHPLRLLSFAFIPSFNSIGLLQPILGVGWTLNYEMLFYFCFSAVLMWGSRWAIGNLVAIVGALFLLGRIGNTSSPALLAFLGNPIILEFLIGSLLGWILKTRQVKFTRAPAWLLSGLALILIMAYSTNDSLPRPIAIGIPAALIFTGFLAMEGHVRWPAWIRFVGDASYSIYLVHILVVYRVCYHILWLLLHHGWLPVSILAAGAITTITAVLAGLACFVAVERSLLRKLQRLHGSQRRKLFAEHPADGNSKA